jgi:hypothetical protein
VDRHTNVEIGIEAAQRRAFPMKGIHKLDFPCSVEYELKESYISGPSTPLSSFNYSIVETTCIHYLTLSYSFFSPCSRQALAHPAEGIGRVGGVKDDKGP